MLQKRGLSVTRMGFFRYKAVFSVKNGNRAYEMICLSQLRSAATDLIPLLKSA
jgi:hypothetical protein